MRERAGIGRGLCAALAAAGLMAGAAAAQTPAKEVFGTVARPAGAASEPIGSYARGCLAGGIALAETGARWQAMRPSRNRNWGHPALVAFVERLSQVARDQGWPGIYVGDMSQPRGGPMLTGHRSHQIGLDADIWLRRPERMDLSRAERETISSNVVVAADGVSLNQHWTPGHHAILKAAAQDPAVDRIFVHPAIKRGLCRDEPAADPAAREWLRKIRPWHGHNAHFHVRLGCPAGTGDCADQPPPPAGDGCGAELDRWIDEPEAPDEVAGTRGVGYRDLTLDELPGACRALVASPGVALPATGTQAEPPEREVTAIFGMAGSRYLWVLPLERALAGAPGLRFDLGGALPPGLEQAVGQEGGPVIRGTPTVPGDYRFRLVARDAGGVRARYAVALTIEPGRGGAAAPAAGQTGTEEPAAAPERVQQVRAFLRGFDSGGCFYAHPVSVTERTAKIEAFSYREAPIYALDADFMAVMGYEATIGGRLVGAGHCAALDFAEAAAAGTAPAPRVSIDDLTLGVGGYLSGRIEVPDGMAALMLVVDPNGLADVVAAGLRRSRPYSFRTRGAVGPHLLVAVAGAGAGPDAGAVGGNAAETFARLSRAGPAGVTLRFFVVK